MGNWLVIEVTFVTNQTSYITGNFGGGLRSSGAQGFRGSGYEFSKEGGGKSYYDKRSVTTASCDV